MKKNLYKSVLPKGLSVAVLTASLLSTQILVVQANDALNEDTIYQEISTTEIIENVDHTVDIEAIETEANEINENINDIQENEIENSIGENQDTSVEEESVESENQKDDELNSDEINTLQADDSSKTISTFAIQNTTYENSIDILDSDTESVILSFTTSSGDIDSAVADKIAYLNDLHGVEYVVNSTNLISRRTNSSSINGNTMTKHTSIYSVSATNLSSDSIDEANNPLYPSDTLYEDTISERAYRSIEVRDNYGSSLLSSEGIFYETVDNSIKKALDSLNNRYPDAYFYQSVNVKKGHKTIWGGSVGFYSGPSYDVTVNVKKYPVTETKVENNKEIIPFITEYKESKDLLVGTERVIQQGQAGTLTSTYNVTYIDGVEQNREFVSEVETLQPTTRIIERGVKEIKHENVTSEIEYEIKEVENADVLKGEKVVSEKGVVGEITGTYEVTYIRGEETGRTQISETVTKEPITEVVQVGTKEIKMETVTESIPFETEYTENTDLLVGETKVIIEGVNGEQEVTYEVTYVKGEEVSRNQLSSKVTKTPTNHVIEVGLREIKTEIVETDIAFAVEFVESSELLMGEERVKQEGQNGTLATEYEVVYVNGKEFSRAELSSNVSTKPVNKLIEKGIREVRQEINTETVPFETERVDNADMLVGETLVSQVGVEGERTITENAYFVKGDEVNRELISNEITLAPVNEIIQVGVKEVKVEEVSEVVEFDVEYIDNAEWLVGAEEVITAGANGEVLVTYEITYVNGEEVSRTELSRVILVDAITEVTERGIQEPEQTVEVEEKSSNENVGGEQKTLPDTGEEKHYAIFSVAVLSILAGIGLIVPRKREE